MTAIIFIGILSALILIHEGGHFFAAKRAGLLVHEFGIGFPPRLYAKKFGETEYSINLLPFGGFVRIEGEDGQKGESGQKKSRSFADQPLMTKLWILLAGVAMNWILAALLFGGLQIIGAPISVPDNETIAGARVTVTTVRDETPAAVAGLSIGDTITALAVDGKITAINHIFEVQQFMEAHGDRTVTMTLLRNTTERTVSITPRANPPKGEGPIGVALIRVATVQYPWYEAGVRGVFLAGSLTISLVEGFVETIRTLIVEGRAVDGLAGPIGIAYITGEIRSLGPLFLINFIAILSLNLAILNAIPFPALDGGRAVIAIMERLRGRTLSLEILGRVNAAGFIVLLILIVAITIRDIRVYVL